MGQSLEVNIKTTSDIPQAMDKAKAATSSFEGQLDSIGKKFNTAFKDIALGFIAPVIILQSVMSLISNAVAQAKADAQAGLDLMAKGNTIYASEEEKRLANFIKAKMAREKEMKEVTGGKREMTAEFLKTPEGEALLAERKAAQDALYGGREGRRTRMSGVGALAYNDPSSPALQAAALRAFLNSEEGKVYKPLFEEKATGPNNPTSFKSPEGFGNVVGVGANPVMEAMTMQLEEARKQTALLESLNNKSPGGGVPVDFTKPQPLNAASRSGSI
jgi:hypothetical protein